MISEISSCFELEIANPSTNNIDFYRFFNFVHNYFLVSSGLILFSPDSVAGYPAHYQEPDYDRHWYSSNTVLGRYKLIESFISGRNKIGNNGLIYVQLNIVNYVRDHIINPSDTIALVTELSDLLYPESIDADRKNYFTENLLEGFPAYYWTDAWSEYLNSNDETIVKSRLENADIVGNIQLDAALDKNVLKIKYPETSFVPPANVLIFPNLDSANIGYKLVQRFSGARAIGPILQGLAKPVNDLSRGCSVDEIVNTVVITANQC